MVRPARLRLRRRLLVWSTPPAALAVVIAVKLISVVVVGNSAVEDFANRDANAVRTDAQILGVANIVEPARASFAAGAAAVLAGRLEDADRQFTIALDRTEEVDSCPVRVNLELVRETQGDRAAAAGDRARADERYTSALTVVDGASQGCFAGNSDVNLQRQAIRHDAANRLAAKKAALNAPPPAAPPPPPPPPPLLPLAPPLAPIAAPDSRDTPARRLNPTEGDPLNKLQQVLQDAASP